MSYQFGDFSLSVNSSKQVPEVETRLQSPEGMEE